MYTSYCGNTRGGWLTFKLLQITNMRDLGVVCFAGELGPDAAELRVLLVSSSKVLTSMSQPKVIVAYCKEHRNRPCH